MMLTIGSFRYLNDGGFMMKKYVKMLSAAVLVGVMAVSLAACGEKENTAPVSSTGTTSYEANSSTSGSANTSSTVDTSSQSTSNVGTPNAATSIEGTWIIGQIIDASGKKQTLEEYAKAQPGATDQIVKMILERMEMSIKFKKEGKVTVKTLGQEVQGTYTVDGSNVTIKLEKNEVYPDQTFQYDGTTLFVDNKQANMKVILVRQ